MFRVFFYLLTITIFHASVPSWAAAHIDPEVCLQHLIAHRNGTAKDFAPVADLPRELELRSTGDVHTVTVPDVGVYAVLELKGAAG